MASEVLFTILLASCQLFKTVSQATHNDVFQSARRPLRALR